MKHPLHIASIVTAILSFQSLMVNAQAPQAISYQGVARDATGNIIASQNISLRFSIHNAIPTGPVVYSETQNVITTILGLFSLNIGQGTVVTGTFAGINWGNGAKFLQVELDASGGTNYSDMGTQQMMSVPYALYSNLSDSSADNHWSASGSDIYNNNPGNVGIGTTTPEFRLSLDNDGGIMARGSFGSGNVIATGGAGGRLIWYPRKGAFRAGVVDGIQWNDINIGNYSFANGLNNTASGAASQTLGANNIASADSSLAIGNSNTSSGVGSVTLGMRNHAFSFGEIVLGLFATDYSPSSTTIFNSNDRLFVVGNGSSISNKSDAVVVLKDGKTGIGISVPTSTLDVNGDVKIRGGIPGLGKVLTSDAFGLGSWQLPVPANNNSGFKATQSSADTIPTATLDTVKLNSELYDDANAFSGNAFTAPVAGLYHFDAVLTWNNAGVTGTPFTTINLQKNGVTVGYDQQNIPLGVTNVITLHINIDIKLIVGDVITLVAQQNTGANLITLSGEAFTSLSGHRVY